MDKILYTVTKRVHVLEVSTSSRVPGVNGTLGVTTCKALRPVGRKLKAGLSTIAVKCH